MSTLAESLHEAILEQLEHILANAESGSGGEVEGICPPSQLEEPVLVGGCSQDLKFYLLLIELRCSLYGNIIMQEISVTQA